MNVIKQHLKLIKTMAKADLCEDRLTAQKLIKKANKIQHKLKKLIINLVDTIVVLTLFSGFCVGSIAAALVLH